jgi:hypothetical protein
LRAFRVCALAGNVARQAMTTRIHCAKKSKRSVVPTNLIAMPEIIRDQFLWNITLALLLPYEL